MSNWYLTYYRDIREPWAPVWKEYLIEEDRVVKLTEGRKELTPVK